jgi:hypothetical protein
MADDRDKTNALRKFTKKYNPEGHKMLGEWEAEEVSTDSEMRQAASEGRYADAAKALGRGLGAAGKRLVVGPFVGAKAAAKRLIDGEKPDSMKNGGKVRSASARADGIATKGKTRGKIVMCGGGMYKK